MSVDYKSSVFLPKTSFPMKAGLPRREPETLAGWQQQDLRAQLRSDGKGREPFILHDGPPYANGHLHIGHALNKILKDVIVRSKQMTGYDANYVPGWDCHGLPIEWKIEEKYRKKKKDKDQIPIVEFRQECREFAQKWIDIQREEFKRLGIIGDWDNPYTTMTNAAEATIANELGKFLMDGSLYRGAKPVMWSPVEKTALAEAEVEYQDHTSTTIFVRFPVIQSKRDDLGNAAIVIWTTTPWTMPGNRAVAYGEDIDYVRVRVDVVGEGGMGVSGEEIVVAEARLTDVATAGGIERYTALSHFKGRELAGTICQHPLYGQGYDFDVPALAADFATTEEGTGIVHIAPGHGTDDWVLGRDNNIEIPETVGEDGVFYDHVPLFKGMHVYRCNATVADIISDAGGLLGQGTLVHRYPHSWRSKKPLIYRNTKQWFISMESNGLRKKALKAIDETRFVPASGQKRLRGMIEDRPDWCVSRQRAWGVPITVFVDKKTGQPLRDQSVIDRVVEIFKAEGSDAWFASPAQRFLGDDYNSDDYEQVTDILDVWFDSGSTHAFVLEARDDLKSPASLYLEGSDQHRGWFHSSLLESCGTRGRAPYESVLTHGFVMAEDGQKMSKSLGNIVSPQDINNQNGADILRLWVVSSDYSEDLRIGPDIIKQNADVYRRLRNTLRFLLGNLNDFSDDERIDVKDMPELERWVMHRLYSLDNLLRQALNDYTFHTVFTELHNFCTLDLSAFYLDIRKDSLYCDPADSLKRRASRTVLDHLFTCLTTWLAPFICFTAEEVWKARHGDDAPSIHLQQFPTIPEEWQDHVLAEKWSKLRQVRRVVTGALEFERAEKHIGSSLQSAPTVYITPETLNLFDGLDGAELFITSTVQFDTGVAPENAFRLSEFDDIAVVPVIAPGDKCMRCYRILETVNHNPAAPETCTRCADVIGQTVAIATS